MVPGEFTIQQWEEYDGEDWWKWAVWVEGSDAALDRIKFVEWNLHPTFPDPVRTISDRDSKFRLKTAGWGTFPIRARVQLKDGRQIKLGHKLKLYYPSGTEPEA